MGEVERIQDQVRRAVHGDAWHGAALLELLEGVTAKQAAARPIAAAHTIWEIVNHIAAWAGIVADRLEGKRVEVTPEVDWPPVPAATAAAWKSARARLEEAHARLERALAGVGGAGLDRPPAGSPTTCYVLAHGAVQHSLYHGGQIALLKKALAG